MDVPRKMYPSPEDSPEDGSNQPSRDVVGARQQRGRKRRAQPNVPVRLLFYLLAKGLAPHILGASAGLLTLVIRIVHAASIVRVRVEPSLVGHGFCLKKKAGGATSLLKSLDGFGRVPSAQPQPQSVDAAGGFSIHHIMQLDMEPWSAIPGSWLCRT